MTMQELICSLGMTDTDLGAKLCVSSFSVTRWRKGRKLPTPMARKALCRMAGVSVDSVNWTRTAMSAEKGTR